MYSDFDEREKLSHCSSDEIPTMNPPEAFDLKFGDQYVLDGGLYHSDGKISGSSQYNRKRKHTPNLGNHYILDNGNSEDRSINRPESAYTFNSDSQCQLEKHKTDTPF